MYKQSYYSRLVLNIDFYSVINKLFKTHFVIFIHFIFQIIKNKMKINLRCSVIPTRFK